MAIPGLKPEYPVRAKVRTGIKVKKVIRGEEKEFPQSVDYFVCDDAEFLSKFGEKPKELLIWLPFERPGDNFGTGLERWDGAMLTCYSKGEGEPPIAYRKKQIKTRAGLVNLLDGFELRGDEMGNERCPVTCRVRQCPDLISKACKPMGRLQFWIDGLDRHQGIFQIDTKSWNSIESVEAELSLAGDARAMPFLLRVAMEQIGQKKFPVLSLEAKVEVTTLARGQRAAVVNSEADVETAEALLALRKAVDGTYPSEIEETAAVRLALVDALEKTKPGWRNNTALIERLQSVGVVAAAKGLLERYAL
jgi:hypothetical protein